MKNLLGILVLFAGLFISCDDDNSSSHGKVMYVENLKLYEEASVKTQDSRYLMYDVDFIFDELNSITSIDLGQGEETTEKEHIDLIGIHAPDKLIEKLLLELKQDKDAVDNGNFTDINLYKLFEVKGYDSHGNISDLSFGSETNKTTVKIEYSSKPFFFYWNLKAAKIFDAIKNIRFFDSEEDQKADLLETLIPLNNIAKVTITDNDGDTMVATITYEYNADNKLTKVNAELVETITDSQTNGVETYTSDYTLEVCCMK